MPGGPGYETLTKWTGQWLWQKMAPNRKENRWQKWCITKPLRSTGYLFQYSKLQSAKIWFDAVLLGITGWMGTLSTMVRPCMTGSSLVRQTERAEIRKKNLHQRQDLSNFCSTRWNTKTNTVAIRLGWFPPAASVKHRSPSVRCRLKRHFHEAPPVAAKANGGAK